MFGRLILAGAVVVFAAAAQPGGGGMGGGMGGGERGGMDRGGGSGMDRGPMGGGPRSRMDQFSELLQLNKDQKKQVKTVMDEGQKEATPVKEQILKARTALAEAVAAGKTGDDLKQAEAACAEAEVHMHQIELSAFAKVYQALDKDQQSKVGRAYAMMAGIFQGKNWNETN